MHIRSYLSVLLAVMLVVATCGCLGFGDEGDDGDDDPNQNPTCSLGVQDGLLVKEVPANFTFIMTASDEDGEIATWILDVDDGSDDYAGNDTPPTTLGHEYDEVGLYNVRLTVSDDEGAMGMVSILIEVRLAPSENSTPQGSFSKVQMVNPSEMRLTFAMVSPTTLWDWCSITVNPPGLENESYTMVLERGVFSYDVEGELNGVCYINITDVDIGVAEEIDNGDYITIVGIDDLQSGEWSITLVYNDTDNVITYELVTI